MQKSKTLRMHAAILAVIKPDLGGRCQGFMDRGFLTKLGMDYGFLT